MLNKSRDNLLYGLLLIVLVVICAIRTSLFNKGFFTFYDDAYFLLKAKEVGEGVITGKSQWNFIAVKWFPYGDLSSVMFSRIAGYILVLAAAINAAIASVVAFGKKGILKYLAICALVLLPEAGQITYVTLQSFLLCTSISAFLVYWKSENRWLRFGMLLIAGFMAGLSLFVIMPGGLLTLACYMVLVLVLNRGIIQRGIAELCVGLGGVILCLAYMHFCICPLDKVVEAMRFTASYFTKTGYHYDPFSFAIAIGLFLRDCIFIFVFYIGAYYLSRRVQSKRFAWIGGTMYLLLVFVYIHYQKKPVISSAMFFSSVVLIPLLFENNMVGKSWKVLISNDSIVRAVLFCFPLIAAMGTNTALSSRITCFLVAWAFLWFDRKMDTKWYVTLAAILIMLLPLAKGTYDSLKDKENCVYFTKGNKHFAEIAITEKQKDYFDRVYDLMTDYGYKPDSSVVFTAMFDYATVYAFDAKLSSNFHQTNNFLYWDVSSMLRPDFIILSGWDEIVMGDKLKTVDWGWPEEFDAYEMGTPESTVLTSPDIEQRTVYCRKDSLNRKEE